MIVPVCVVVGNPATEVNAIVPVVVVGAAGFEPAGSLPRAPRPASIHLRALTRNTGRRNADGPR